MHTWKRNSVQICRNSSVCLRYKLFIFALVESTDSTRWKGWIVRFRVFLRLFYDGGGFFRPPSADAKRGLYLIDWLIPHSFIHVHVCVCIRVLFYFLKILQRKAIDVWKPGSTYFDDEDFAICAKSTHMNWHWLSVHLSRNDNPLVYLFV